MTETKAEVTTSFMDTLKNYATSKRMIYLLAAIILCIGIYFYMTRKTVEPIQNNEQNNDQKNNVNKQEVNDQAPEIIFSQELVQNLYRNNSNPINYLIQLQQQGQIPQGPLPKIVIDNTIQTQQFQQNIVNNQESQPANLNEQNNDENKIESKIDYAGKDNLNFEDNNTNHYERIEDDDEDDLIGQKLTKEEIEDINKKILSTTN